MTYEVQPGLVADVRDYWFNNRPGDFAVGNDVITREQIQTYGGPIPRLAECPTCQQMEWLTRVSGINQWQEHTCIGTDHDVTVNGVCSYWSARNLCEKRMSEEWTQAHQNFEFMFGVDPDLNAPRCLFLLFDSGSMFIRLFRFSSCDNWPIILRRQLAQACQVDAVIYKGQDIDWDKYDFCFLDMDPNMPQIEIPIPLILFGFDWLDGTYQYQGRLDFYKPDIFLTPYPCAWQEHYKFDPETVIRFYSLAPSTFFIRPNIDGEKELDLLSIGKAWPGIYTRRIHLHAQVMELADRYRVEVSKNEGVFRATWDGANYGTEGKEFRYYLNAYSKKLSTAHFVTYGPVEKEHNMEPLMAKYYECLSSGAIPILPDSPDRAYIGVKPWVHYIPLEVIWQDNDALSELLDDPGRYKHIAHNAVNWTHKNMDAQIFDVFEEVVRGITNRRHPKRKVRVVPPTRFTVDETFDNARLDHLGSLGLSFKNKRVLEVGAGIGSLTHFWEDRGCEIVSTESRYENMDGNLKRHPWRRPILHRRDVTQPGSHTDFGLFDILFCYGLLYHVPDPAFVIGELAALCTELFLVDTMVNIEDGKPQLFEHAEGYRDANQGTYSLACTPTRSWFMKELGRHFPYVYVSKTQPKNQYFHLGWPVPAGCITRAIFVGSRSQLSTEALSKKLLRRQVYYEG